MPKITKRLVEALEPGDADELCWCSELRGFGVRVFTSGVKSFIVQYRNKAGATRKITLGRFGPLSVEQARTMALKTLADVAHGEDPSMERKTYRKSMTVAELCTAYIDAAEKGFVQGRRGLPKKASTLYTDKGRIERHIKPQLGRKKLVDLKPADIERFKQAVASGKTAADVKTGPHGRAIVAGGRGTATRTLGLLGSILSYGVRMGALERNPAQGIEKFAYRQNKTLLTPAHYQVLGTVLSRLEQRRDAKGLAVHNASLVACIRLIALTGLRLSEAQGLRWAEVDFDNACLRLGDTKTGASLRPLGKPARDLLQRLKSSETADKTFVFPSATGKSHTVAVPKFWRNHVQKAVAERAKAQKIDPLDHLTLHGLRHSFAGTAESLGLTIPTIAALLGHSLGGVTGGYILKRLDAALIAAADQAAESVDEAMGAMLHSTSDEAGAPAC